MRKWSILVLSVVLMLCIGIIAQGEEAAEITAEFTFSEERAMIGHPFTVGYELNGGSGEFEEVHLQAVFTHSSRNELGYEVGSFTEGSGSCTFIPEEGEMLRLMLHGRDTAGQEFYIHKYDIPVEPNADLPVQISFDREEVQSGETLTASYEIAGAESFSNIDISWTVLELDPEIEGIWDYSEGISPVTTREGSGEVSYTPAFGDVVYLVIRGSDAAGRIFYAESTQVMITAAEPGMLILPESVVHVGSQAFINTKASRVVFPESIEFIAQDAFTGSNVLTLQGGNVYVENYAAEHGFEYVP